MRALCRTPLLRLQQRHVAYAGPWTRSPICDTQRPLAENAAERESRAWTDARRPEFYGSFMARVHRAPLAHPSPRASLPIRTTLELAAPAAAVGQGRGAIPHPHRLPSRAPLNRVVKFMGKPHRGIIA